MSDKSKITIKKGSMVLTIDRDELVEVSETHDGIVFSFKGGGQYYYTNNFMESAPKQMMKQAADNFQGKNVIFNLDNLQKPALVEM